MGGIDKSIFSKICPPPFRNIVHWVGISDWDFVTLSTDRTQSLLVNRPHLINHRPHNNMPFAMDTLPPVSTHNCSPYACAYGYLY